MKTSSNEEFQPPLGVTAATGKNSNMSYTGSNLVRSRCRWYVQKGWRFTRIGAWVAIVLMLLISGTANAEGLRLLLIPYETSIKPGATVAFDVYLYNPGSDRREAPSLELLSMVYTIDDVTGTRLGRAGVSKETSTGPRIKGVLEPGSIEHRKVSLQVLAETNDLVKVYVEVGKIPVLRSNSALLFCPVEAKKSH